MPYQWKHSTTPGDYNWSAEALAPSLSAYSAVATDVRKGIARYSGGPNGSLEGTIDTDGVVHATGIIHAATYYASGYYNGTDAPATYSLYTLISGVADAYNVRHGIARYTGGPTGLIYVPSVADVRKGVLVNVEDSVGTLVGIIDADGVNQGDSGMLGEDGVYHSSGIIDVDGNFHEYGIFEAWGGYYAYGTLNSSGDYAAAGIIHTSGTAAASGILNTGGDFAASGYFEGGANAIDAIGLYELVTTGDTRVAAQLQDDKDAVTAGAADILDTRTILTVTGTFDLAAAVEWIAAAQLATDVAAVEAKAGYLDDTQTILGVAGTLDMDLYLLKTDVTAALNTNKDEMIPDNASLQALYGCDAGTAPTGGGGPLVGASALVSA